MYKLLNVLANNTSEILNANYPNIVQPTFYKGAVNFFIYNIL